MKPTAAGEDEEWSGAWLENVSRSNVVGEEGVPASIPLRLPAPPAPPTITIGRLLHSVDVFMDSPLRPRLLSRRHAELSYDAEADVWLLSDLKSVNGIFVNRKRTPRAILRDGDIIAFDVRGSRTPVGGTKDPSKAVCVYRFHQSGGGGDDAEKGRKRRSGATDAAPPAKKKRTGQTAKAASPDSQEEDDDDETKVEEEEEEEEEAEEEEAEEKEDDNEEEEVRKKVKEETVDEEEEEEEEGEEEEGEEEEEEGEPEEEEANKSTSTKVTVGCLCGEQSAGKLMIRCDACNRWSHARCEGLSKAKAAQLKEWQCKACSAKGKAPVAASTADEEDPRQWTLSRGTIICCLPEPSSGDQFWIAEVVKNKRKGQRTVLVRWFEHDPRKRPWHYVQGAEQRLDVSTITSPDVSDLLIPVAPDLFKLREDPRLYTIA